jgi:putative chitinase
MLQGKYTGKKLGDYFNDTKTDPLNARRIINGMDKADAIRVYYNKFSSAF